MLLIKCQLGSCIYPKMAAITKVIAGIRLTMALAAVEEAKYRPSK